VTDQPIESTEVLITGGAGFIGSALARRLVADGARVAIVDSLHPQVHPSTWTPSSLPSGVQFVPMDVTHETDWRALLRVITPDVVVHLAAETGTGQSLTEASRHAAVNVVGTTRLLDALIRSGALPGHIVLASSRAVYGEGQWERDGVVFAPGVRSHDDLARGRWDFTERGGSVAVPLASRADRTPTNPTSIYGATKLAQEHVLGAWCAATGCSLSIARLQNVYGPGQSMTNSYTGIVTLFARQALAGETMDVFEDGKIVRDFVYIDDVVDALMACIVRPAGNGVRVVDVGSGSKTTILDLANLLAQWCNAPEPKISGRFRDGDVRAAFADISLATATIGYRPTWELADGLAALLEWMRDQHR